MQTLNFIKKLTQNHIGLLAGLMALALRWLLPASFIEQVYSRGVYQAFRAAWDHTIAMWLPFAIMYIFIGLLLYGVFRFFQKLWKAENKSILQKIVFFISQFLNATGWLLFLFFFLWGYNYGRVPIETQLHLTKTELSVEYLAQRVQSEARALNVLRKEMTNDQTASLPDSLFPVNQERLLRTALELSLKENNFPTTGRVRGRKLAPKGIFLRFSSAGLYFPWTGEGHIDAGLLPIQQPSTMAHEMAHGYGFGDEGTCSFWAFLAGEKLQNKPLVYAIRLSYWRTLAATWRRAAPEVYEIFYKTRLSNGIKADLLAIRANNEKYPDIFPEFRDAAYEAYLKSQGIEEGLKNYSKVIDLVEAWKER